MGAVYKARDPEIDRTVALKTINPLLLTGHENRAEFLERFRREARAAGRLSHPNIVSVYDLGTDEATSTPFIVMEYVAGISLEAVLKENPSLPVDQAVEILEQVASALEEAHRSGVVHRDVKPANVFLDAQGRVKVGDFGIARLEGSELTQTGVGLGTPGYSPPEVLRGGPADARSDVFALGVLAYRILTGQRPFAAATREAAAIEILERIPPPPRALRPDIPEHVSSAVMHALAKSADQRTASAEAFAAELRAATPAIRAVTVEAPSAPQPGHPETPVPTATVAVPTIVSPGRRRRLLLASVVLLALGALATAAFVSRRPPPAPEVVRPPVERPRGRMEATPPAARPVRTAPAPAARSPRPTAAPGGRPVPPADGGRLEEATREAQRKIEDRLREEWRKATEKTREDDKKAREKRKKGSGRGGERN